VSRSHVSAASPFLIGAALAAVAFGAAGGTELGRTSTVELLLVIVGAAVLALAVLSWREGALQGGPAILLFCGLVGVTVLSVIWSIAPELSFVEAGRLFAYLAVFAAAVATARMAPGGAPTLIKALLLATMAVVAYALASRVWPGTLAKNELSYRLGEPYGYWNAVGTTAAMAVPPALWLGSRESVRGPVRALAYPALGLAILTMLLTESRGALVAAAIGAALWFGLVPLRLRSLPVLVIPILGVAPVAAWALSKDAFSKTLQPLAAKEDVAGEFGLLLLLMILVLAAAGLGVEAALERRALPERIRRRVGIAAIAVVCALPVVAFTSVAFSSRGLGGTIHDRFHELTSETASTPGGPGRLTAASSSRGRYWRQAGHVFADRPWIGTGAGTFGIARLRYRKDELVSRHAHGYIPQTLADTGLLGLFVTLGLLAAWLVATGRTTALYPRFRRRAPPVRRDWHEERIAIVCLALVAVVFGLQSAIDWTWFVPGPAVMALAAAGFVAGRGPLPALGEPTPAAPVVWPPSRERSRMLVAGGVMLAAVLCAWSIWQPEASDRASNDAVELVNKGDGSAALSKAEDAHDANPLSPRPLLVKASALASLGRKTDAVHTLEHAVIDIPGDPQTWIALADYQLNGLDRPLDSMATVRGALYLDPRSKAARRLFLQASDRERQKEAAPPPLKKLGQAGKAPRRR
jgi:type II secretory pathway component PulM